MKNAVVLMVIGLILNLSSVAQGTDDYTETLVSNTLIGGGTAMGWHIDDGSWLYTLPFSFPYYGNNYTSVYVCSNGFINFTSSTTDESNSTSELMSRTQIAPLWDDLMTNVGNSDIYIHQPTANSVCIRWYAVEYSDCEQVEFEVVLYQNGDIKFNYGATGNTLTPTVGISKGDNTHYLLSGYNNQSSLNNAQTSFIRPQLPNQPPHLIRFQARLEDVQGNPLDGSFDLTFKIYDSATGGTALWQETQANVNVEEGLLDVKLGSVTALNLPFDKQYWLGVQVEADGEMTPRFKLTTVPYSFKSEK